MILKTIWKSLRVIYGISKKYFIMNILITVLSGTAGYLLILSNKLLLNRLQVFSNDLNYNRLIMSLIIYAAINLIIVILRFVKQYFISKHRIVIQNDLDIQTMKKNGDFSLEDYENMETYSLIQEGNELGKNKVIEMYLSIISIFEMAVSITMGIYMIISLSPDWWIVFLFLFPIIKLGLDVRVGKINYKKEKKQIEPYRKISYIKYLTSNDIAKKEIVSYNFFPYWLNKFKDLRKKLKEEDFFILKKTTSIIFLANIIETLLYIVVICVVVIKRISVALLGDIFAYIDSIMMIQNNTTELLSYFSDIYKDSLYAQNYFKFIDRETYKSGERKIPEQIDLIQINNLIYRYSNGLFCIRIKDLTIKKGQPIVVLGENGSGKSTLLKLIGNLYHNYQGEIKINDDISIKDINQIDFFKRHSILFQDFNKYEATLKENVATSNAGYVEHDKLHNYISSVQMDKETIKLESGYETMIGSWFGNTVFSGGQWQRLAIARCLIKESDAIIMDEPSSALDVNFEKQLFKLIESYIPDKILIIVVHKLTQEIINLNPKIIIMKEGEITEQGLINDLKKSILTPFY